MAKPIGIDLGTTNSVVSIYNPRGGVETLKIQGESTMPSVVSFRKDGKILVGKDAKKMMSINPDTTVASVKRFMGDRKQKYNIAGKTYTPTDISRLILEKLKKAAEEALGEPVYEAVITIPAYFNEEQREDTKRAAEEAGFKVLRLEPEPTAAAIAYGLNKGIDQTVMVFDLGGGTFDVSILEIKGNEFKVKGVGGNSRLGGDDFDQAIVTWASQKFKAQTGIDIIKDSSLEARLAQHRLKEVAEVAKKELSEAPDAHLEIPNFMGHLLDLTLTLNEYNQLIEPLVKQTIDCLKTVLKEANLSVKDIDRLILVGGSTRNRLVYDTLAREVKEPFKAHRVDEIVAHGAAIVADDIYYLPSDQPSTPSDQPPTPKIKVKNVGSHSLGIDLLDSTTGKLIFSKIIPKNTPYPCRHGIIGYTIYPMQPSAKMRVFRGEDLEPDKNKYKGELVLHISPPQKDDVPVGAIFNLDNDGILYFKGVQFLIDKSEVPLKAYCPISDNYLLDLEAVDKLIESGKAKAITIKIENVL